MRVGHAVARPMGSRAKTRVPPSGRRSTATSPPTSAARSRIDSRPVPARGVSGRPRPSSVTSTVSWLPASQPDAACAVPGVADGVGHRLDGDPVGRHLDRGRQLRQRGRARIRPRSPPSQSRRRCRRSRRAAWWPIAPARPSSSSAGGRSPSTRRRTSASASRTSALSASSWRRAASGSSSSTAADASARMPIAASDGPRPSWRSSAEAPPLLLARDDELLARAGQRVAQLLARGSRRRPGGRGRAAAPARRGGSRGRRCARRARGARPARRRGRASMVSTVGTGDPCSATTWLSPTSSAHLDDHIRQAERVGDRLRDRRETRARGRRPTRAACPGAASPASGRRAGRTSPG